MIDPLFILEAVINGILLGGVLALLALGLNLIFGVIDIIWIAYVDLVMLCMYAMYFMVTVYHWPIVLAGVGSLVLGAVAVRLRGSFSVERAARGTIGRLRFVEPAEAADLETLRRACRIDGAERCIEREEAPELEEAAEGSVEQSDNGSAFYPAFLQPAAV